MYIVNVYGYDVVEADTHEDQLSCIYISNLICVMPLVKSKVFAQLLLDNNEYIWSKYIIGFIMTKINSCHMLKT